MRMKKNVLSFTALIACMCIAFTSCSGGGGGSSSGSSSSSSSASVPSTKDSSLLGKWETTFTKTTTPSTLEFKNDGTCIESTPSTSVSYSWGTASNKLYFSAAGVTFYVPYKVSGDKLTISYNQAEIPGNAEGTQNARKIYSDNGVTNQVYTKK